MLLILGPGRAVLLIFSKGCYVRLIVPLHAGVVSLQERNLSNG